MVKIPEEEIEKKLLKQIINLIQIGWRGRIITIGYDETVKQIKKGRKGFLILAEDIAERTKRNILKEGNLEYFQLFTKSQLGNFIGKKEVGIIFVPTTKFGLKLKGLIAQYFELKRR
ncbi:Ribosomal protein L7Ae [Persephonella hydrogeniphila]|uniref:Ribosomal protein L7Ae n=1 Tax=Persephonella hydrogeniphila TaxID=198703 RepID=A0A285NKN3_9AQUI|nr:ribosomal L7Ae/L30e/S12e/Gadd45 family protein [Persephonella hydrogeniphila]SNZ09517.1 Ribosomal protein L7Ae [Persephonella hydrogeniphila]